MRYSDIMEAAHTKLRVYRVEHSNTKVGPYTAGVLPPPAHKPHPDVDGMIHWEGKAFGFESMNQLKQWFSDRQRAKLRANGFVADAEYGISQVAFDLKDATLVAAEQLP